MCMSVTRGTLISLIFCGISKAGRRATAQRPRGLGVGGGGWGEMTSVLSVFTAGAVMMPMVSTQLSRRVSSCYEELAVIMKS